MFDGDNSSDATSKRTTRRVFLACTGAAAASLAALWAFRSPGIEASTTVHGTPGEVTLLNFNNDGANLGPQTVAKNVKTEGE